MRVLLDTNVLLDVLLRRDPWVAESSEDNLQIACANLAGLDAIVTRDRQGFEAAAMPVLLPEELLRQLR